MKLAPKPLFIKRGSGVYLYDDNGRAIIDAIGSWWVNIHGHSNPIINTAIRNQLKELAHVIYAGLAHTPAVMLSQKLSETTGHRLNRVFFSDNGSTAVEIALKMAYQYFWNQGKTEQREFITLGGGYHGDTFGAMSVGERGVFHQAFAPLLFHSHQLPRPHCPFTILHDDTQALRQVDAVLLALKRLLTQNSKKICAVILEPIIQGASASFNFYPPVLLRKIREICDQEGVLLIADEVFTGCGRTGPFYACERAGIWPDIMTLSKGLAAGYLPFAATLATQTIYDAFYSDDRKHTLFHGHSMTGNLLGCTAALASLDLLKKNQGLQQISLLEKSHLELQQELQGSLKLKIHECRALGSVGVVELKGEQSYTADFGWQVMQKAISAGVLLRPLGNVIYLCPPYCITKAQLAQVYAVIEKILVELG